MEAKIGIVGLWHLGCVIAASWSKLGFEVVGFDYETERVKNLQNGIPPIFEPGLTEEIQVHLKNKLQFTTLINDLSGCDFIFLSYDTAVNDQDESDTSLLTTSIADLTKIMKNGSVLIVSSQSPVGYCVEQRQWMKKVNSTLEIAYSPENLRLGEAIQCYLEPGRIILGTEDHATEEKCKALFSHLKSEVIAMNLASSELVKHGINSFLAMSIVFANNLADICEEMGGDIKDVVKGLKSDPRIGFKSYLSPGIGFSGGTLGRDLKVLEAKNKAMAGQAEIFSFVHGNNGKRKNAIVQRAKKILTKLDGQKIAVLGLTYKPNTSTLRRSLPLEIVELLVKEGASISVYDPKADYAELEKLPTMQICTSIEEAVTDAALLLLLTEWDEFKSFDWDNVLSVTNQGAFFDTKNCIPLERSTKMKMKYYSIGKS